MDEPKIVWTVGPEAAPTARLVSVPGKKGKEGLVLEAQDGRNAMGVQQWCTLNPVTVPKQWLFVIEQLIVDHAALLQRVSDQERSLEKDREALLRLLRERSFKKGEFTLSSGRKSDFFIDCTRTVLSGDGHYLAGRVLWPEVRSFGMVPYVAGAALGGCPLAGAVSLVAEPVRLDILYVRRQTKDHGTKRLVEGDVRPPAAVVLLEDVVTTGATTIAAVKALEGVGLEVVGVVVLVDRQEGGFARITAELDIPLRSIFTREDFIPTTSRR